MPSDTQKTIAGTLLLGASALTGNALVVAAAQGVGGNWISEGLLGLWSRAAPPTPRAALVRAGETAIERAVDSLQHAYRHEDSDIRAFALLRECAPAVAVAQYPPESGSLVAVQQALARSLNELLHGHAARQFIEDRLLDAVAVAFREALAADEQAWRLFHGWLLEQLVGQSAALGQQFAQLPAMLQDQQRAFAALHAAVAQIRDAPTGGTTFENSDIDVEGNLDQAGEDMYQNSSVAGQRPAAPPQPGRSTSFRNTGVKVKGNATQAGGSIYHNSAHAQGAGSSATVNNTSGDTINIADVPNAILNVKSDLNDTTQSIGDQASEEGRKTEDE